MAFRKSFALIPAAAAIALAPLAPAMAQDSTATPEQGKTPEAQAQAPAPAKAYSEEQLSAFVTAAMDVAELRQDYAVKMKSAEDDAARKKLVEEANADMRKAVEEADGITVEQYIEIGRASAEDKALNDRIVAMLQERLPAAQGGQAGADKQDG